MGTDRSRPTIKLVQQSIRLPDRRLMVREFGLVPIPPFLGFIIRSLDLIRGGIEDIADDVVAVLELASGDLADVNG